MHTVPMGKVQFETISVHGAVVKQIWSVMSLLEESFFCSKQQVMCVCLYLYFRLQGCLCVCLSVQGSKQPLEGHYLPAA